MYITLSVAMKNRLICLLLKLLFLSLLFGACKRKKEGQLEDRQALEAFDAARLKLAADVQISVTKYDLLDHKDLSKSLLKRHIPLLLLNPLRIRSGHQLRYSLLSGI